MSTTKNYGLYVTEPADDPNFIDWRTNIAGATNSNMTIIDEALAAKSEKSKAVNCVLLADGWDENKTQVLSVEGLGLDQNGSISIATSATVEARTAARYALFYIVSQAEGSLTIGYDGALPSCDVPVTIILN